MAEGGKVVLFLIRMLVAPHTAPLYDATFPCDRELASSYQEVCYVSINPEAHDAGYSPFQQQDVVIILHDLLNQLLSCEKHHIGIIGALRRALPKVKDVRSTRGRVSNTHDLKV